MTALTIAARASQPARLKVHLAPSYEERPLKVLCATDLWASSDFAVQRALTLAEAADARLLLLHVVDEDAPLRILGRRAERAHSALRWRVQQQRPRNGPPAISVRIGKPRHMIARVARDCNADLIVLGPYRARTADWLLGTTAERLALVARRPILVVNRQCADEYGDVALAAGTLDSAKRLARTLSDLMMVQSPKPLCRTMLYSRRGSGAQADVAEVELARTGGRRECCEIVDLDGAGFDFVAHSLTTNAPQLVATSFHQNPLVTRALGRNMVNTLLRHAASDVLIAPEPAKKGGLDKK